MSEPAAAPMATWKLIAGYAVWLVASAAIAIASGGFVAIVAGFVGVSTDIAAILFDVVTVAVFVACAALPFLLRGRFR